MRKRVLVIGKDGQLGQSIKAIASAYPQHDIKFVGRDTLDLSSSHSIADYFSENEFDVIINCAAYTAVDGAETEPELADQINHRAVKLLAEVAKMQDALLIQISTDYVFNGQNYRPYIESDPVEPKSVYGLTKYKGEQAMQVVSPVGCIIRTSWVYSEFSNNFVKTMLKLGSERDSLNVVFDQVGSPTYAGDLAQTIIGFVDKPTKLFRDCPVYHYSNEGVCSWYDFAKAVFELAKVDCKVLPIETKDYPTPAMRPYYSLLNKFKIKETMGIEIPFWRDSLTTCLIKLQS